MSPGNVSQDLSAPLKMMVAALQKLLGEMATRQNYRDFIPLFALVDMMRRHGVDPDPSGTLFQLACFRADGADLSAADIVHLRSLAHPNELSLEGTKVTDSKVPLIPATIERLSLENTSIADSGISALAHLAKLTHINLANTRISDNGLSALLRTHPNLVWVNVFKTAVTDATVNSLCRLHPNIKIERWDRTSA